MIYGIQDVIEALKAGLITVEEAKTAVKNILNFRLDL